MIFLKVYRYFKVPIDKSKSIFTSVERRLSNILHKRMLNKRRFIKNIKKFFSLDLKKIEYNILTPSYEIKFSDRDKQFFDEFKNIEVNNQAFISIPWPTCPTPKDIPKIRVQREIFTCKFSNVKFFGRSGVFSYHNKPIMESASTFRRFKRLYWCDNFLLKHRRKRGVYTSIMHYFANYNHTHWLVDNLPRLYGILKINGPEIFFIIPPNYNRLQMETLKIFLDKRFKLIKIGYRDVWKLENFYFSSFSTTNCSGFMPKQYLDFVRNKFLDTFDIEPKEKNKRIYLSRVKDRWRHIVNENKLIEILKKYDFKIIHPVYLTLKEQAKLFNSAEIIVGPHGSAFANLIFTRNCKVLEMFSPYELKGHFYMLGKALKLDYYTLIGDEQFNANNFKINPKKFENKLLEVINN